MAKAKVKEDKIKDKDDCVKLTSSEKEVIKEVKPKVKKLEIAGYKVILTYSEYRYKLDAYEIDEDGDIVCSIYNDKESAINYISKINSLGLCVHLKEIYRKEK